MDNVLIKGAGKNKLWKYLTKDFQKRGHWGTVISEHSNQGMRPKRGTTVIPRSIYNYDKFNPNATQCRIAMKDKTHKFYEFFSRLNRANQNHYGFFSFHFVENIFNILINYYYSLYEKNKITLLILNRPPHIGQDYIAYEVAKAMDIKTLILFQAHQFEGRFLHVFENDDFGEFKTSVRNSKETIKFVQLKRGFEKELDYMQDFYRKKKSIKATFADSIVGKLLIDIYKGGELINSLKRFKLNYDFEKNYKAHVNLNPDLNCKYVYFPLHLQPEMTTSNWGGIYCDQVLAIEHLSSILPADWNIYVKENPKQGAFQRGALFYQRLKAIPNVIYISKKMDTYNLLQKCQFTATITGTVGWEAITGGKPVVLFGTNTWYQTFPGVHEFSFDLNPDVIAKTPIDHKEVELAYNQLMHKTNKGRIYSFSSLKTKDDILQNVGLVENALKHILKY